MLLKVACERFGQKSNYLIVQNIRETQSNLYYYEELIKLSQLLYMLSGYDELREKLMGLKLASIVEKAMSTLLYVTSNAERDQVLINTLGIIGYMVNDADFIKTLTEDKEKSLLDILFTSLRSKVPITGFRLISPQLSRIYLGLSKVRETEHLTKIFEAGLIDGTLVLLHCTLGTQREATRNCLQLLLDIFRFTESSDKDDINDLRYYLEDCLES